MAALNLGIIKAGQRAYTEAQALLRAAMDSGHPRASPIAAYQLGGLLDPHHPR